MSKWMKAKAKINAKKKKSEEIIIWAFVEKLFPKVINGWNYY